MKTSIQFKANAQGNVEVEIRAEPGPATAKERQYTALLVQVLQRAIPEMGKQLGAKAAIFSDPKSKPHNQ